MSSHEKGAVLLPSLSLKARYLIIHALLWFPVLERGHIHAGVLHRLLNIIENLAGLRGLDKHHL